jgi:hypothetical protein
MTPTGFEQPTQTQGNQQFSAPAAQKTAHSAKLVDRITRLLEQVPEDKLVTILTILEAAVGTKS